jgi:hypothetical protein
LGGEIPVTTYNCPSPDDWKKWPEKSPFDISAFMVWRLEPASPYSWDHDEL